MADDILPPLPGVLLSGEDANEFLKRNPRLERRFPDIPERFRGEIRRQPERPADWAVSSGLAEQLDPITPTVHAGKYLWEGASDLAHGDVGSGLENLAYGAILAPPGFRKPVLPLERPVAAPALAKMGPPVKGDYFYLGALDRVPNVPQEPLPRWNPPRGVPERMQDLIGNRKVWNKVRGDVERGIMEGGPRWYNTEPLAEAFGDVLGNKGPDAYKLYMDLVAGTSPRSAIPENIRNASYYYSRLMQGTPFPNEPGYWVPEPYGHIAQRLHQMNVRRISKEGGFDPEVNPKPLSFSANLRGNQTPVTLDSHAFRLPVIYSRDPRFAASRAREPDPDFPKGSEKYINYAPRDMLASGEITLSDLFNKPTFLEGKPRKTEYGALEDKYSSLANRYGITPAQVQASAWIGGGGTTGLRSEPIPFMKAFEQRLQHSAEKRGVSMHQALEDFIRGTEPLRAAGGSVLAPLAPSKEDALWFDALPLPALPPGHDIIDRDEPLAPPPESEGMPHRYFNEDDLGTIADNGLARAQQAMKRGPK